MIGLPSRTAALGPDSGAAGGIRHGAPPPRPRGALVWCHAADPARLPVLASLARDLAAEGDQITLLATAGPGEEVPVRPVRTYLPAAAPADQTTALRAFLSHWQPDAALWLGGALRPRPLAEVARTGVPMILADAGAETLRSHGTFWRARLPRTTLQHFCHILCTDAATTTRLLNADLTGPSVETTGRIDEGHSVLPCPERDRAALAAALASRPCWLAADPETGAAATDLAALAIAHRIASHRSHRLLMLVAAADPGAIAAHFAAEGFATVNRLTDEEPTEATEVLVGDLADLGLFYRLAPISYLGGSLGPAARRDPFEAAGLGSALLHGPVTAPHAAAVARLDAAGAARAVRNGEDLGATLERLLSPDRAAQLAHAAWDVASEGAAAANRLLTLLRAVTDRATPRSGR